MREDDKEPQPVRKKLTEEEIEEALRGSSGTRR